MTQLDSIRNHALQDLSITTEQGEQDVYLWEHAARVARNAHGIAGFESIKRHSPDEAATVAAALYHDAAWAVRVREGQIARYAVHVGAKSQDHREQSAAIMEKSLAKLLPKASLARASQTIRTLHDHNVDSIEGRIVADAENLDEFGLLSLWPNIRRGALEGKGVRAAIDTWQRRAEYEYWPALLRDSFQFDEVREIARRRLQKLEQFMADLRECQEAVDVRVLPTPQRSGRASQPTA